MRKTLAKDASVLWSQSNGLVWFLLLSRSLQQSLASGGRTVPPWHSTVQNRTVDRLEAANVESTFRSFAVVLVCRLRGRKPQAIPGRYHDHRKNQQHFNGSPKDQYRCPRQKYQYRIRRRAPPLTAAVVPNRLSGDRHFFSRCDEYDAGPSQATLQISKT